VTGPLPVPARPAGPRPARRPNLAAVVLLALVVSGCSVRLSSDPYTGGPGQHATQVEPDSFSSGSTIVSAFQTARIFDGGAMNIGWARSGDAGATWSHGFLPGITTVEGGIFSRVSDPAVAYDARHGTWLISSLGLFDTSGGGVLGSGMLVSRSTNGGTTWGNPVRVATAGFGNAGSNLDKNWIACDNTPTSPFYGRCYVEWDDNGDGNRLKMSTSADGGVTWGPARNTADNATGLGGQPVVQPDGTVIVPSANANATSLISFTSTNGGASWNSSVTVSSIAEHGVAGGLRTLPLPSAEVDGAGRVYVAWQDCRFRAGCTSNDIVMSTSDDGLTWTSPQRIPIDAVTSTVDHFIPGLGVDVLTSSTSAHLALTYYFYPETSCTAVTCRLFVGAVTSVDGGQTWSARRQLEGPMELGWLADTSQGRMVGDYISTSFANGTAHPVYARAQAPSGGLFNEWVATSNVGLGATADVGAAAVGPDVAVSGSDHDRSTTPAARR